MIKQFSIITVIVCTIFSCKREKENVEKIYFADGNIKFEFQINKDSIIDGFCKEYYKNGKLKSNRNFKNGKLDSIATFYFENGDIEKVLNYSEGYLIGSQKRFFPNNKIKQYSVIDGFGDCFYVIKYDSNGSVIKQDGGVISPNIYCDICKKGSAKKGQIAKINLMCSTPPNTTTEVYYGEISNPLKSKKYERLSIHTNNIVPQEIYFSKKGIYKFYFLGILKNLKGNIISKDSIYQEIKVN